MTSSLLIDGTPQSTRLNCRFRVYVNSEEIWVRQQGFSLLTQLAVARVTIPDGFVEAGYMLPGSEQYACRYIWKLRQTVPVPIQTNKNRLWCLAIDPRIIHFNHRVLCEYPDRYVASIFIGEDGRSNRQGLRFTSRMHSLREKPPDLATRLS